MSAIDDFTLEALEAAKSGHTYRTMRLMDSPEASHVKIADGTKCSTDSSDEPPSDKTPREVFLLASNSYLDLCNEPSLKQAAAEAVLQWGTGSGGARLTTGNKTPHENLERAIAEFKGTEAAITFGTGYMANVGVISALCSKQVFKAGTTNAAGKIREVDEHSECIIFSDELNHASIIDGIRLSRAKCVVYKHNDMADLQQAIANVRAEQTKKCDSTKTGEQQTTLRFFIVTDAVFSMDGDVANLPELLKISRENNCLLMIDEAHATGVIGKTGRGLAEFYNDCGVPCEHADVTVGTLSKAVGTEGGFVAGSQQLIDFIRNKARSFIFTTAMSPAMAQAAANNLQFIKDHPERVLKLQENVATFCEALSANGIQFIDSRINGNVPSAIVPIVIGDEAKALKVSADLLEKGIMVPAIRYPTVAKGKARLRASIMATHSKEELQMAANAISEILKC